MSIARTFACLGITGMCLLALAAPLAAQEKDVVWAASQAPADACIVATTRSLQELETSLKVIAGPEGEDISIVKEMGARLPAGAFDVGGPVVLVVLPGDDAFQVVGLLRVRDETKLAGESVDGGIVKVGSVYVRKMAPWAAVSDKAESLKAFAAATARMSALAAQPDAIDGHQVWVQLNGKTLAGTARSAVAKALKQGPGGGAPGVPPATGQVIDWAIGLLDQVQSVVVLGDVKAGGVTLTVNAELVENSPMLGVAAGGLPIQSYSGGLPAGDHMMAAGWFRMDWTKAMPPMKALIRPLLDALTRDADAAARKSLDEVWALYDQWAGLFGTDMAMVAEPAAPGQGMYRLVETFTVKDVAQYRQLAPRMMTASKDIMKVFMGQMGAMSGGPTMKMDVEYQEAAEMVEDVPVDVMRFKIDVQLPPDAPPEARANFKAMMDAMYGPEGMTMRMAVADKAAVMVLGDAALLARAIRAARGQGPVLAAQPQVAAAVARLPKDVCAAGVMSIPNYIYMAMSMVEGMIGQMAPPQVREAAKTANLPPLEAPPLGDLATLSVRVQGRTVSLEVNLPQSEIRGAIDIGKKGTERIEWYTREMQKAARQQQGAGQPGAAASGRPPEGAGPAVPVPDGPAPGAPTPRR
jgi:hypothetical protein